MSFEYVKPERISLWGHPELSEKWVQARIAEDPTLLGLGDLILKDKERIQPRAGRLDLLFQDAETSRRYEVEIQLGSTDEAHIIRTIEYWDIERKRYPQYDHTAVIIAENIDVRQRCQVTDKRGIGGGKVRINCFVRLASERAMSNLLNLKPNPRSRFNANVKKLICR
jgi:hypothetical protein